MSRAARPVLVRTIASIEEAVQATDKHPKFGQSAKERKDGVFFLARQKKARVIAIALRDHLSTYGDGYTRADKLTARDDMKRALRNRLGLVGYWFWINLCISLVTFFLDYYFAEKTPLTSPPDFSKIFHDELRKSCRSPINGEFTEFAALTANEIRAIEDHHRPDTDLPFPAARISV